MPIYSANRNAEHLSKLQALIADNFMYNEAINNDSIVLWEQELEPQLTKEKKFETIFLLKQMVVYIYANRGDMSIAIDYARLMYDKAKSLNHEIGIALSSRAIGDTYLNANMPEEGIAAYEEAIRLLKKKENTEVHQANALPKLIMALIQLGQMKKANLYLKQLDAIYIKLPSESTLFDILSSYAYYYIKTDEVDKAKIFLDKANQQCNKMNSIDFCHSIIDYLLANYYQATSEYKQALTQYQKLQAKGTSGHQLSSKFILLYVEQAKLLLRMGHADDACRIYQLASQKKDSLNSISYARQINSLRTTYQIDLMEIEAQAQRNQILFWGIVTTLFILLLITLLIFRIRIENKNLLRSQTQLEKAKKYAESSIMTKSLFLSNMSHEIRTPLNALSGFSAILTDESIDNETRQQCNDIIQQNSELLLKLINDVIDLSSLDVGKLVFNFKTCDAVSICRNVVDTVAKIKQTQASISFITSLKSLELLTDDSRLQQVLINLLINATKFTTEGTITLELSLESDTIAKFAVTDTGCGIPLFKQSQIFNRFEKLNEGAQGTGLGLSICQLIIEQIGGNIEIDSTYTAGARFMFTHPIHPEIKKEKA